MGNTIYCAGQLATDANGNLFTGNGDGTISEYTVGGVLSTFASGFTGESRRYVLIEPGAAGARSPEPNVTLVATPVMPPRTTARTVLGFIST